MPYSKLPSSVPFDTRTLKTSRDEWKNTINPANRALTADQWSQLDDVQPGSRLNKLPINQIF